MPYGNTLKAELSLGLSKFEAGLRRAQDLAGDASAKLAKKFDMGAAVSAISSAFTLSFETIATKLSEAIVGGTKAGFEKAGGLFDALNAKQDELLQSKKLEAGDIQGAIALLEQQLRSARAEAETARAQFRDGEGPWAIRASGGLLRGAVNNLGLFGAESESDALERQGAARNKIFDLEQRIAGLRKKEAEDAAKADAALVAEAEKTVDEQFRREKEMAAERARAEREITVEKERQTRAVDDQLAKEQALLAQQRQARREQEAARAAVATALSDQSAATLDEITGGTRGTAADRLKAQRIARLRQQANAARDTGRSILIGGQAVSTADLVSSRANALQSGLSSLNSAERNPLAAVEAELAKHTEELQRIAASLEVVAVD